MYIASKCLLFAIGIILVVKGGDIFVDAASWIARALKIPSFIIGATIVSLATTMPEMLVSVLAAAEGKTEMAVGNAVGSVTANTGLILAVAMLAMTIKCSRKQYMVQCLILIASAVTLLLGCLGGEMGIAGSVVLLFLFILFMWKNVKNAKGEPQEGEGGDAVDKKGLMGKILLFLVGAAGIVGGSQLMVDNGGAIATWFGVPERVIAVTLVAIGTSLPEFVTTITAIIKKESALSVGNVIGANIIDLSLILPICSLVSGRPLPVSAQSIMVDIPVCLALTLVAIVPLIVRQKAFKVQGALLLCGYAAYLVCVL